MLSKWAVVVFAIALGYRYWSKMETGPRWAGSWMPEIPLAKEKLQEEYDYVIGKSLLFIFVMCNCIYKAAEKV